MRGALNRYVIWGLLSSFAAVGCSDSGDAARPNEFPFETTDAIYVVTDPEGITVMDDRVRFERSRHEDLLGLAPGTFVVGDRQRGLAGGNPQGFLRQVVTVSDQGEFIVVNTSPAFLDNVIKQGKFSYGVEPVAAPIGPKSTRWQPGLSPEDVFAGPELGFPDIEMAEVQLLKFSETWPLQIKGQDVQLKVAGSAKADLTGKMVFSPSIDIGFHVENWQLKEFHTILIGETEIEVIGKLVAEISAGLGSADGDPLSPPAGSPLAVLIDGSTEAQRQKYLDMLKDAGKGGAFSWPIYANTFQLPTVWLPTVPPIPIVTGLNVDLTLECPLKASANITVKSGARVSGHLELGARYTNYSGEKAWSGVSERTLQSIQIGPDITGGGGVTFGCSLKPSIGLIFYGLAGPTVWASGGARIGLGVKQKCDGVNDYPTTQLYGQLTSTLEAGVGAKFGLFAGGVSMDLASTELTLFSWEKDLVNLTHPLSGVQLGVCANNCADPPDCKLGDIECTAADKADVCKLDAGGCPVFKSQDCTGATSCYVNPSACLCGTPVCTLGDLECSAGPTQISVCEADSNGCVSWVLHSCKTSKTCYEDPALCANGSSSTVCAAGSKSCNAAGTAVQTCRTDGSGWDTTETCSTGACVNGACVACSPSWTCSAWSTCGCNNTQTRTCTDSNGCGTTAGKPSVSQGCDPCTGFQYYYCGASSQFPGGCLGTLYNCGANGTTVSATTCPYGCQVAAIGVDDYCKSAPACGEYLDACTPSSCCTTYACVQGYCCHGTGTKPMGESCGSGGECCSGRCVGNLCCGNDSGTACSI